jgi:acyl carrier protein
MDETKDRAIQQRVRDIVVAVSGLPKDADANADLYLDLGVASFHALLILQDLEDHFGIHIPDDQFVESSSITKLTATVEAVLNAADSHV